MKHNVRGHEDLFTLDKSGFEFQPMLFHMDEWNDAALQANYIPFLEQWLRNRFECERLLIYAYNVCCQGWGLAKILSSVS